MIDDRELNEIEACAARGIAFPDGYRRMAAEIRRLQAAVNAAELRGQDTGLALARSTVLAWVKRHEVSGTMVDELIAEFLVSSRSALSDPGIGLPGCMTSRLPR